MGKLVFAALLGQGHLNILYTIGKYILANHSEHEIYFLVNEEWDKKVKEECPLFKTLVFHQNEIEEITSQSTFHQSWLLPDKERLQHVNGIISLINLWKSAQDIIEKLVLDIKPNLILYDNLFNLPFLMNKNIPWGIVLSTNPLYANDDDKYPPIGISMVSDPELNKPIREEIYKLLNNSSKKIKNILNDWLVENQCEPFEKHNKIYGSNYINLFNYPDEVTYFEPNHLKGRWFKTDSAIISNEINDKLKNLYTLKKINKKPGLELLTNEFLKKSGKLILFSLGTIITKNFVQNQRFINMLDKLPHKFVVSKGKEGDQIILPDNCVGANYVNMTELLQKVDLMIGHGGNNTFTECFYYGVPMILIPAFGDQYNNAARIDELGYGIKLDIKTCTFEKLKDAIDKIINNKNYNDKMKKASERIQKDKSMDKFCEIVVNEFLIN